MKKTAAEIDLRQVSRASLIELIIEQRKKIEELEEELEKAEECIQKRAFRLDIEKIGHREDLTLALSTVLKELEDSFETE